MHTSAFFIAAFVQTLTVIAYPLSSADSTAPTPGSQLPVAAATTHDWKEGYVSEFLIHSSCNATERHELTEGLRQAVEMAEQAKNHILVHGSTSAIYQKYFGRGPTGTPLGWLEKIASGNRAGILFRCDDPDRNCATQDDWAGHWRGSNATSETVICPLSYSTRLPLTAMCARGFHIATGRPANYWGPDLMHRLYHVPLIGEGIVEHYADGYHGVQELAAGSNFTWAGSNSATLTYFATEVYAYDIAVPGQGCVGKESEGHDEGYSHSSSNTTSTSTSTSTSSTRTELTSSATAAAASASSVAPTRVVPAETSAAPAVAAQSGSGTECHTHDDGVVHCD